MGQRTGSADLPLHGGKVPPWLSSRMARLGRVVVEAIAHHYGRREVLRRLSHPFWFQSFGAVMGMDWHSSGITTSVIGALKRGLAPVSDELGLWVCGGRGRHSRMTPQELSAIAERRALDGVGLVRASRLVAKVDSAAVQDGFALYLHGFFVSADGEWTVVQQGMNPDRRQARRYHWSSETVGSFLDSPHAAIEGRPHGKIVNLADRRAEASRMGQLALLARGPDAVLAHLKRLPPERAPQDLDHVSSQRSQHRLAHASPSLSRRSRAEVAPQLTRQGPGDLAPVRARPDLDGSSPRRSRPELGHASPQLSLPGFGEVASQRALPNLQLPAHHEVTSRDVVLRRLHGTLAAAAERGPKDFAELLLTPGVGARTVEALAHVAEVVHGAPCRFSDPARFSFAHGGKDGHPFPVPLRVYDETIRVMKDAVTKAKLGNEERLEALRRLDAQARALEATARGPSVEERIAEERERSHEFGGMTVDGPAQPPRPSAKIALG